MTAIAWLVLATAASAGPARIAPAACARRDSGAYPDFCSIPPVPRDVRAAEAFKAAVVDTRLAGRRLVRDTDPSRFSLAGTDAFAAKARREATPPPPITTPSDGDTAAFVKSSKARATPPPRPR